MSEKLHDVARNAVAVLAAATALAGCAEAAPAPPEQITPLAQCYDAPLPSQAMPELPKTGDPHYAKKYAAWDKALTVSVRNTDKPIDVHYDSTTEWITEDPADDPTVEATLKDANVIIEHGDMHGSGLVTTDAHGEQVIVTAAHVVANNNVRTLKVTNSDEQVVHITRGCYMYEDRGKKVNLTQQDVDAPGLHEYDIAVLRPDKPLSSEPLKIAKGLPSRGTWLKFVNNQLENTPDYPADYNGLVVSRKPDSYGDSVLTGLEPWQKHIGGESSYTINPGASGGMVANIQTGEVVGISVGGEGGYIDSTTLHQSYNVDFNVPTGNKIGIVPVVATVIGGDIIRKAVASPHY